MKGFIIIGNTKLPGGGYQKIHTAFVNNSF